MYAGSMKTFFAVALAAVSLNPTAHIAKCQMAPQRYVRPDANSPGESRPDEIIGLLHLKVLPRESGYLGIIGASAQTMQVAGRPVAIQSQVYYMLTRDLPVNYLHWLAPDDTHVLIEGGPVDYFIFHPDGHVERITLGRDLAAGERPVVAVPGGCWKALRLREGASYALMANALSPEFTPDRVRIGAGADWVKRYTGAAAWATEENLRALIGPNWTGK
jgi:predicted cupin superfamily sugar epimerase